MQRGLMHRLVPSLLTPFTCRNINQGGEEEENAEFGRRAEFEEREGNVK